MALHEKLRDYWLQETREKDRVLEDLEEPPARVRMLLDCSRQARWQEQQSRPEPAGEER